MDTYIRTLTSREATLQLKKASQCLAMMYDSSSLTKETYTYPYDSDLGMILPPTRNDLVAVLG